MFCDVCAVNYLVVFNTFFATGLVILLTEARTARIMVPATEEPTTILNFEILK